MFFSIKKIIIGGAIALIFVTPVTHAQSTPSDDPTVRTTLEAIKSYLETRLGQLRDEIGLTTQPVIVQQVTKKSSRSSRNFSSSQVDSIYENLNENISGTESSILASLPQIIADELLGASNTGLTILDNGNVGIGTDSPLKPLHVSEEGLYVGPGMDHPSIWDPSRQFTATANIYGKMWVGSSNPISTSSWTDQELNGQLTVTGSEEDPPQISLGLGGASNGSVASPVPLKFSFRGYRSKERARIEAVDQTQNTNNSHLAFYTSDLNGSDFAERVRISADGNLGVGTTSPNEALEVTGTIRASNLTGGATNLTTDANGNIIRDPSDIKLKKNINTLEGSLDRVLALRGVSYDWKDTDRFGTQTEIGFIAQEVELIVPEVVRDGGEYMSINTRNLIAIAVGGIQELYEIVIGFGERFETDELCVEGVCINGEQLSKILEESGYSDSKTSNNDKEEQDDSEGSSSDQDEKQPKNQEPDSAEDSEVAGEEEEDENSSENIDDGNEESEGVVSQAEGEGSALGSTEEVEGKEQVGDEEEIKNTASEESAPTKPEEKKEESTPETEEENNEESENEGGTELTP